MRVRFGECLLDTDRRELLRAGSVVPLLPKAFLLLQALLERAPNAVSQEDLRALLWADAAQGGTRVARLVNELRTAIGDERPWRLIRTVQRFGYAFCGSVVREDAPAVVQATGFAVQWGPEQVPLGAGENVIGRSSECWVHVASLKVSRQHARILVADGRAFLEDLGSRNGTFVDERRIEGRVELKGGEQISVGPALLIFRGPGSDAAHSTD